MPIRVTDRLSARTTDGMFLDVKIRNLGRDFDGRNWARTSDLQRVELALVQLSYAPRGEAA